METWPRVVSVLCGSNPLRFDDYVLMILLWTRRIQFLRFHLTPIACIEPPPAWTVRVGWCGDFCKASLRPSSSPISLAWITISSQSGSPSGMKYMPRCSLAASNFCCLLPIYFWLYAVGLLAYLAVVSDTHTHPSSGFALSSANRFTPIQGSDSDLWPSMFYCTPMVASWSTSKLVCVCAEISCE